MDAFHTILVDLHSINRWLILLAGLYTLFLSGQGWLGKRDWIAIAEKSGKYFVILLDIQLLLGIALYIVFITRQGGFSHVFGNPASRFFIMEHSTMMALAIIVAHVGAYFVKKSAPDGKYKRMFITNLITFLLVLISIPWPFMPGFGRPLFF